MSIVSPLKPIAVERLADLDKLLEATYGTPESELGNQSDPLDEAIYIILSFQTDLARFSSTWSRLRAAYPSWDLLQHAPCHELEQILRGGGLHRQKAKTIRRLLAKVRMVSGQFSLDFLRDLSDDQAERMLISFPGLSWKAARCVLLYSCGRNVLPVDSNTFRILKRTGILARRAIYRRRTLHDAVQTAVPASRRRALHVNLVVHGQRTCLPRNPHCQVCPLNSDCPRIGLTKKVCGLTKKVHRKSFKSKS